MTDRIVLANREIGAGRPVFVVAEMSTNHNGSFERAAAILRAAKEAGADAVKLQTYTAETMTIDCASPDFVLPPASHWAGWTRYGLYQAATTPWEWQPELKSLADALDLVLFSSPFDATAVDFLEKLNVPAYKIASFELVDDELLACVAATGKPVLLATGLADEQEIKHALEVLDKHGNREVALLHCISAYPARTDEMNLRTLPDMKARFGRPTGLSDHSLTNTAALCATALGACVIEKHFTLDRASGGLDADFSVEPQELAALIREVRALESALGEVHYGPTHGEMAALPGRRSLYVVRDVSAGEAFTRENLRSIRPGGGLAPRHLESVLGRRATRDVKRGEALTWEIVGMPTE